MVNGVGYPKRKATQRMTMRQPLKERMCGLKGIQVTKKTLQILETTPNTPTSLLLTVTIHVHYRFESKTGGNIDYELNIQESTGRFTANIYYPRGTVDRELSKDSGTCMIFKQ